MKEKYFLDAPGGTGKTFINNLLVAKVRFDRKIALTVASSGTAATLLEGGQTNPFNIQTYTENMY